MYCCPLLPSLANAPYFLSLSSSIYFMYLQLLQEMKNIMDFSPRISDFRELSVAHPCVPQCAALVHGLNDSNATRSRPRRPPVRSYTPYGSVRDCFQPLPTTQLHRAPCSPPFPFMSLPHLHVALAIQTRHAGVRAGPIYDTLRPAEEACKTTCAASHPH